MLGVFEKQQEGQWLEQDGLRGKVVGHGVDRDQLPKAPVFKACWGALGGFGQGVMMPGDTLPQELILSNNLIRTVAETTAIGCRGSVRVSCL